MNTSLSILLPVYNAQTRLETGVAQLLDVAPELTRDFELLIVDDGSLDDTIDVARELARSFPQVKVVRHGSRLGLTEAIRTGLDHTSGEIVLVGDEERGLEPDDLRRLWRMRHEEDLVVARQTDRALESESTWIEKLLTRKLRRMAGRAPATAGVQMIRRQAFEELQPTDSTRRLDRTAGAPLGGRQAARPNYLGKAKRFAAGE